VHGKVKSLFGRKRGEEARPTAREKPGVHMHRRVRAKHAENGGV